MNIKQQIELLGSLQLGDTFDHGYIFKSLEGDKVTWVVKKVQESKKSKKGETIREARTVVFNLYFLGVWLREVKGTVINNNSVKWDLGV